MLIRYFTFGAAALALFAAPAAANPGDYVEDYRKKISAMMQDCDKKLSEAQSRREYREKAAECDRELDKLYEERRIEAAKERREADQRWRERSRDYYDQDD